MEHLLYYLCDETGSPLGMQYRTSNYASGTFDFYFFEKNLQGDIVAVYNSNGKKICTYTYDAWGNCTTTRASGITSLESQIASSYNPFRYNSYVRMSIPHPQDVTSAYNYAELKQFFYAEEGTYTFSVSINRWSMRSDAKVQLLVYDEAGDIVAESAPAYAYDTSYSMSTLWERISVTFDTNEYFCYFISILL